MILLVSSLSWYQQESSATSILRFIHSNSAMLSFGKHAVCNFLRQIQGWYATRPPPNLITYKERWEANDKFDGYFQAVLRKLQNGLFKKWHWSVVYLRRYIYIFFSLRLLHLFHCLIIKISASVFGEDSSHASHSTCYSNLWVHQGQRKNWNDRMIEGCFICLQKQATCHLGMKENCLAGHNKGGNVMWT